MRWVLGHMVAPSLIDYFFKHGDESFFAAIENLCTAAYENKTVTMAYKRLITRYELRKAFRAHYEAEACALICENRFFNEGLTIPENAWSLINLASSESFDDIQQGQIYQQIQREIQPKVQRLRFKWELPEDFAARIHVETAEEAAKIAEMDTIERTEFIFEKGRYLLHNICQRMQQENRKEGAEKRTLERIEKASFDVDINGGYRLRDTVAAPEEPSPLLLSHEQCAQLVAFYGEGADRLVTAISENHQGTRTQWAEAAGLNLSKVKRFLQKFRETQAVFKEITGIDF